MKIEQIYTGCLAQGAYYIESGSEAVIIDPLREVDDYLKKSEERGTKIKYVLETHFHADFVSGHLDLSAKTGAPIVFGPLANPEFPAHIAQDGEILQVGKLQIQVLHTPGHTMESTCYLLKDEEGKDVALFTGDTLFIGDVGRPDLAQKLNNGITQEILAGHLYESLRNKIMPLADSILIYPAHGAGSACGKNISSKRFDTLGNQKASNYALQEMTKEEFVKAVTKGLMPPPSYFAENVLLNIKGYESVDTVIKRGQNRLGPEAFERIANETRAVVLDTRSPQEFAKAFIPKSINIGIDGGFAPWVGALIKDIQQPILLVCDSGREIEVITRLARVGYDNTLGYLDGGIVSWKDAGKEVDSIESIDAEELFKRTSERKDAKILDVRKSGEYESGHLPESQNMPLDFVNEEFDELQVDQEYFVHCAGGYRSMVFISILKARGYEKLVDVAGGFKAIEQSGLFQVNSSACSL